MNNPLAPRLIPEALAETFWRVVCLYKCAEASGQNRGVTLATPNRQSPLQVIEKRKLKSVPKLTFIGPFAGRQAFGGNGKLLGNLAAPLASVGKTSVPKVASK
jgi:hypothetical protein